ncbi:MAG: DUF2225 domain-containing protein [Bacillota bacterium]
MSSDVFINFLRGIPLFGSLGPVLLARLAENIGTMKFESGQSILAEGQHCNNLFIVVSGRLEVYKSIDDNTEVVLQTLNRGGIFGETYILDGSPADSGLRAAEKSVVIFVDRLSVTTLFKDSPEFPKNYLKHVITRNREGLSREDALIRTMLKSGLELPETYSVCTPGSRISAAESQGINEITNAEDDGEENADGGVFFRKEYTCPLCRTRFNTLKPRQKYVVAEKMDEDFCMYYKTVNPIFYEINVCPKCGYSFNNSTSGNVRAEVRGSLARTLGSLWKSANYCGPRSIDDAIETFKLAIECQRLRGADDAAMGRLFLKRGWLYRYNNKKELELRDLERALNYIHKSYDTMAPEDPKDEMNLMFLMGHLNLILGNENEALKWFVMITQHPQKSTFPYLVNRARDKWQDIRSKR